MKVLLHCFLLFFSVVKSYMLLISDLSYIARVFVFVLHFLETCQISLFAMFCSFTMMCLNVGLFHTSCQLIGAFFSFRNSWSSVWEHFFTLLCWRIPSLLFSFSWHFFPHKSHSLGSIFSTDELHAIFSGSQNPELSTGQWGPHRRKPWAHSALSGPVFTAQHLAFLCQSKSSGGFAHFCRPVVLKPGWTLESRGGNVWKYWSGPCPKPISLGSLGASGGSVITLY